jgi:hypothetical protein
MATLLYPHLTVDIDTESFFADLVHRYSYNDSSYAERLQIRDEIKNRRDSMQSWLTEHEYQCGQDYFETETGYRFANNGLAIAFVLACAR